MRGSGAAGWGGVERLDEVERSDWSKGSRVTGAGWKKVVKLKKSGQVERKVVMSSCSTVHNIVHPHFDIKNFQVKKSYLVEKKLSCHQVQLFIILSVLILMKKLSSCKKLSSWKKLSSEKKVDMFKKNCHVIISCHQLSSCYYLSSAVHHIGEATGFAYISFLCSYPVTIKGKIKVVNGMWINFWQEV